MSKNTNLSFLTDYITADITNGRIGINNASPTVAFDVTGVANFSSSITATKIIASTTSDGDPQLGFFTNASTGTSAESVIYIKNGASTNDATFVEATGTNFTPIGGFVQDGGVVGTGTALSGGLSLMVRANADMRFYTNGHTNERMRIGSDGTKYFGIYNTSRLQINPTGENIYSYTNSYYIYGLFNDSNSLSIESAFAGNIIFRAQAQSTSSSPTTATERMRITSAGNVGIGTTSPAAKLEVQSPGAGQRVVARFSNSDTTAGNIAYISVQQYPDGGGTQNAYFGVDVNDNVRINADSTSATHFAITSSGNVLIGTITGAYKLTLNGQPGANGYTAWTNYSDLRLKENIQPFVNTNILDKINLLNPVTFNYNEASGYDEETRARRISGFIAQELQEIFPEMVGTLKLNDKEYLDTNLSNLSLYLVKAVQELSEEIKILKQK